jgi:uncharacterized membrane protein
MHLQAAFLFAQEIGKVFALTVRSFKLNNLMTTHHKNYKNITGGS